MEFGSTFLIISVLIVAIWIIIEIKRMKHKLFAIFLIFLILFSYFSFTATIKGQDINFKTFEGISLASKLYFSWLGNLFTNMKSLTAHAINMDWSGNETST